MALRRNRMVFLATLACLACQHTAQAQAAEPLAPPTEAPAPTAKPNLPDKAAQEAASKAVASIPACSLKPTEGVVSGLIKLIPDKCTTRRCIRTCCNTCSYTGLVSGNGPQRALTAAQFRQLFPAFPEQPLECEINVWNEQLKAITVGITVDSPQSPATICLKSSDR